MIRQHLCQAWTMMKQQRLFTGIYIAGTALSIAMAMTIFVILYIKLGPLYPEENRDRMVYTNGIYLHDKDTTKDWKYFYYISLQEATRLKNEAKYIKEACIRETGSGEEHYAVSGDGGKEVSIEPAYVDNGFWRVFNFKFLHGRPFTEAEEHTAVAVVTASLAQELYATTDIVGREVYIDNRCYKVIGVVEDQRTGEESLLSGGDIFTSIRYYRCYESKESDWKGYCNLIMLAESPALRDSLQNEIIEIQSRMSYKYRFHIFVFDRCDVKQYWQGALGIEGDDTLWDAIQKYIFALLAFLLIPALNLTGMISSRMNSRLSEIGVRKSYGATDAQIISQVLCENLLLTLLGAIAGLGLSYAAIYKNSNLVLTLLDKYVKNTEPVITADILFNPTLITAVLGLVMLLNVASALVPALFALRRNIIESLYNKR